MLTAGNARRCPPAVVSLTLGAVSGENEKQPSFWGALLHGWLCLWAAGAAVAILSVLLSVLWG